MNDKINNLYQEKENLNDQVEDLRIQLKQSEIKCNQYAKELELSNQI